MNKMGKIMLFIFLVLVGKDTLYKVLNMCVSTQDLSYFTFYIQLLKIIKLILPKTTKTIDYWQYTRYMIKKWSGIAGRVAFV